MLVAVPAFALCAVAQKVVGKGDCSHRFAHRNAADTNTRIMATLGDDIDFLAIDIKAFARGQDRAGRFDGKAHDYAHGTGVDVEVQGSGGARRG